MSVEKIDYSTNGNGINGQQFKRKINLDPYLIPYYELILKEKKKRIRHFQ